MRGGNALEPVTNGQFLASGHPPVSNQKTAGGPLAGPCLIFLEVAVCMSNSSRRATWTKACRCCFLCQLSWALGLLGLDI